MAAVSETITFELRTPCDNPVYIRWKILQGGWNYYLFDLRQLKNFNVDSVDLFQENFKFLDDIRKVLSFYRKKSRDVWTLLAENITTADIELVQGLSDSPEVELYLGQLGSPASHTFETVLVNDFNLENDTYKKRGNVSVQIRLLERQNLRNL